MTDRAQFEAMLEALINDDQQKAKEIFHNIVVGKSREIYEELLAEDFNQDTGNPYANRTESMEEEEEEESVAEDGEEEEEEEEEEESIGGEEEEEEGEEEEEEEEGEEEEEDGEEDPFAAGDEEGGDEDLEDRVMDLEDALEDLKAEFEQLLAGEEAEEHDHPGIHDMGGDDMGGDMDMDMEEEDAGMPMMEYVNKVGEPYKSGSHIANTSDNLVGAGTGGGYKAAFNRKSVVASKNDMGGTASNIAQNHVEVHGDAGTKAGGTKGGLADPNTKDLTAGLNVHNRPGSTATKTAMKKQVKGGGIDRQQGFAAKGDMVGAHTGDMGGMRGEQNTKAIIGKRVR